ncbi:hypothetical protein ACFVFI_35610 [Streptomyces sp. NPDC057705]|uniref:hypothetical protein n=1 Tax=Streptomyces sp. NPDC057705 TaxID=3346222 RepID=UPI0036AD9991
MADLTDAQRLHAWGRSQFESEVAPVVWAGRVLRGASQNLGAFPEIDQDLLPAETEEQWPNAYEVFCRLRQRGLDQKAPLNKEENLLFTIAELVAKVAHNATGIRPPFDTLQARPLVVARGPGEGVRARARPHHPHTHAARRTAAFGWPLLSSAARPARG